VDKTGVDGHFDFELKFGPEPVPSRPNTRESLPIGPSIFTALREQLGLRLVPGKFPLEIIEVEHAEAPVEN